MPEDKDTRGKTHFRISAEDEERLDAAIHTLEDLCKELDIPGSAVVQFSNDGKEYWTNSFAHENIDKSDPAVALMADLTWLLFDEGQVPKEQVTELYDQIHTMREICEMEQKESSHET